MGFCVSLAADSGNLGSTAEVEIFRYGAFPAHALASPQSMEMRNFMMIVSTLLHFPTLPEL
jgi:hypothetical protein